MNIIMFNKNMITLIVIRIVLINVVSKTKISGKIQKIFTKITDKSLTLLNLKIVKNKDNNNHLKEF